MNINLIIGQLYTTVRPIDVYEPRLDRWTTLFKKEILLLVKQDEPRNDPHNEYIRMTFLHGPHIIKHYTYTFTKKQCFEQLS